MSNEASLRPASTVVLLRDGRRGPEVCLVERRHPVAFMAGAHVFPGGGVDPCDDEADETWCDVPDAAALVRGPRRRFWLAAVREVFEETGQWLAPPARDGGHRAPDSRQIEALRAAVHDRRCTLREAAQALGARVSLPALVPFAHWVTPPIEIRRFDAWFFLARAGEHGALRADGVEVSDAVWLTPSDALAHASHGGMRLPPPTWTTLREIERFATVDDACAWAAARPIVTRQPALVERDGTRIITLPPSADAGGTIGERRFVLRDGRWTPCE